MLLNVTRDTTIAENVAVADTHLKRLRGLIGRPPLRAGQALVIKPSQGIHTFFMGYPIDVIYLDADSRIIRALDAIRPYRFGPIDIRTRCIVEMPAGTLQQTGTTEGDVVAFR
ncbi:MAG: DUF192 domain-containing protein [Anaerolineae bacterium]